MNSQTSQHNENLRLGYRLFENSSVKTIIIQKPVNQFATQIKGLVSIWYELLLKDLFKQILDEGAIYA